MYDSKQLGGLSDRELLAESRAYEVYAETHRDELNLSADDVAAIRDFNNSFEATLDQWDAIQSQESEISQDKKDGRKSVLDELRRQRNELYSNTSVSDKIRAGAGLPPRDTVKSDAPTALSAPIGWLDFGKLKIRLHFRDSATPDSKAKPAGQLGAQIWEFIGDAPPTSEADFRYLATDTNSPYDRHYTMADAGKRVFFLLRWVTASGETGVWGVMLEGTIIG